MRSLKTRSFLFLITLIGCGDGGGTMTSPDGSQQGSSDGKVDLPVISGKSDAPISGAPPTPPDQAQQTMMDAPAGVDVGPGMDVAVQPPDVMHPPPPGCTNGLKDGDETDTDCGGSCPACFPGSACRSFSDCNSSVCAAGK